MLNNMKCLIIRCSILNEIHANSESQILPRSLHSEVHVKFIHVTSILTPKQGFHQDRTEHH